MDTRPLRGCRRVFILLVLLLLATAARAVAGNEVSGVVRDSTSSVIKDATVVLRAGDGTVSRTTVTTADGRFTFKDVAAGRYLLVVSFGGFADRRVPVTAASGQSDPIDILLFPTPVTADVTVTATSDSIQARTSVAQQINVIGSRDIVERAKTVVAQAIVEEPGVNLLRTAPTMANVFVRGLTGNKVNVFVDGIRYSNSAARGSVSTFFDLVDPTSLQAVEVLRGPNSTQYGSDAIGGSVQFLSQVPSLASGDRPAWSGSYTLRAASADASAAGSLSAGYAARNIGLFTSFVGRRTAGTRPGKGIDSHAAATRFLGVRSDQLMASRLPSTGFTQYGGMLKANWSPSANQQLLVSYTRNQQDGGTRYDQMLGGDGNLVADLRNLMLDFFYAKYSRINVGVFDHVTATYSVNSQREERVNQGGNGNPRNAITHEFERTTAQGLQLKAAAHAGRRHEMLFGGEFYPEHVTAPSFSTNPVTNASTVRRGRVPDGASYSSAGVYAQDSVSMLDGRLRADGGVRYSRATYVSRAADSPLVNGKALWPDSSMTASNAAFRAGIVWAPKEAWTLRANASRGFRAPHITDLGTLGLAGSSFTASAAEVVGRGGTVGTTAGATAVSTGSVVEPPGPETSLQYEAGVGYHTRRFSTDGSFFVNTIHGIIAYQALILPPGAVGSKLGDQTISAQTATGVVYVPASSSPVVVRANFGDARIVGFEHTAEFRFSSALSVRTVLTLLHAEDMATGLPPNIEGGTPGPDFYLKVRYSGRGGRYWIEPIVHAVGRQDRLSTLDLEDQRVGATRTTTTIRNFFYNGATVRGWVTPGADGIPGNSDDVLAMTGETLARVQNRVLGNASSAPLWRAVPGWVTVAVRAGVRLRPRHEVVFEVENVTDKNYRGIGWGIDGPGAGLSVAYVARF